MFFDPRLGNATRWRLVRPKDWNMRVPDAVLKTVVFLGRSINKGPVQDIALFGTGFFVCLPAARKGRLYVYLVTAKHVADSMALGDWVMRFNTTDGQFVDATGEADQKWWLHPTESESVDAAVTHVNPLENSDVLALPVEMLLGDEEIAKTGIGVGDEVFIAGLFNRMRGRSRNIPVIRTGNVAMIPGPGELVPGVEIIPGVAVDAEAYLIEARSIGGLSGSPVFVRETIAVPFQTKADDGFAATKWCHTAGAHFLLGLVHGHWDVHLEDVNEVKPRYLKKTAKEAVNLGFAVVVPAKKIREILYRPELVEDRREWDRREAAEDMTTPD